QLVHDPPTARVHENLPANRAHFAGRNRHAAATVARSGVVGGNINVYLIGPQAIETVRPGLVDELGASAEVESEPFARTVDASLRRAADIDDLRNPVAIAAKVAGHPLIRVVRRGVKNLIGNSGRPSAGRRVQNDVNRNAQVNRLRPALFAEETQRDPPEEPGQSFHRSLAVPIATSPERAPSPSLPSGWSSPCR